MPMHDWTRVTAGASYNFHYLWLAAIMDRLNGGVLTRGWFAMAEQRVDGPEAEADDERLNATRANRIAIHHDLGTIVAVLEVVSPGNKDTKHALRSFAGKSAASK